jgi:hypothetical protein
MSPLGTLYLAIPVAILAVVAIVLLDSVAADLLAGLVVAIAFAVATRAIMRLAADQ